MVKDGRIESRKVETVISGGGQVEIAKGAGHAMPPSLPEYKAWLRTNSLERELGWDGFDIAMHELGHNLEQLYGHHFVARPALRGVPNNACTEAFPAARASNFSVNVIAGKS